ncbi:hypothetical protein ACFL3E_01205 [Patescibacteria group bacterium]
MLQKYWEIVKSKQNDIFVFFLVVLLVVLSVGLFRIFSLNKDKQPITIQEDAFEIQPAGEIVKAFMASKAGEKYYPIDCKASNRIKPANRIYFATAEQAIKAGYERTVMCK